MEQFLSNLLITGDAWPALYMVLSVICVVLAALCSLFIIVVVLLQQGNSNGVGALGGNTETFYGRNKSKTLEQKLKKLTVVCVAIIAVLMIAFFLLKLIP